MSPSRLFILRPVATTLLMVGVLLVGFVALSATAGLRPAGGRLPNHSGSDVLSGRRSRCDGVVGDFAAGAAVRAGSRTDPDDLNEFVWQFGDHAAVRARPEHRRRRAAGASRRKCGRYVPAGGFAESSDLQQSKSRRFADSHAGDDFRFAAFVEGGGSCRHGPGAENLAIAGRGAGLHQRRAETRGASAGKPNGARFLRLEPRRYSHGTGPGECGPGKGRYRWCAAVVHHRR